MPTKSVWARSAAAVFALAAAAAAASAASGEPEPNTVGMSIEVFSSSMLAVPTPPTSHPARVNGTQGAGAFLPCAVSMLVVRSVPVALVGSNSGEVQEANEVAELLKPLGK